MTAKTARKRKKSCEEETEELRSRLDEAEEALRAIRTGEVDAIVAAGPQGEQVFSLKTAEHPYRVLVESMNEGAVTLSPAGDIIYCNQRFADLLGKPLERIIGTSFLDCVSPEDREKFRARVKEGFSGSSTGELNLVKEGGSLLDVYVSIRVLHVDSTAALSMVVTDLTEEKRSRERLSRAEKELSEAKRLSDIGTLAATVAHELRNPLAAIRLSAENIRRRAVGCPVHSLANIEKKINESDQIINNLLFYTRLKPPHYEEINVLELLKECIDFVTTSFAKKQVKVTLEAEGLADSRIEADPLQLKELFMNILNNAWDVVPAGTGAITVIAGQRDGSDEFVIRDNGSGIDPEHLQRLFKPFFSTKTKGTGLGLFVSQEIVKFHKGRISIESEKGKGTSVFISLPRTQ